jgi:hypothetical protein
MTSGLGSQPRPGESSTGGDTGEEAAPSEPPASAAFPRRAIPSRLWLVVLCGLIVCGASLATAEPAKPDPGAARLNPAEITEKLNGIIEAERALAVSLTEARGEVEELGRVLQQVRDDMRQTREAFDAEVEQTKAMREEVRGLYVESSGLKGDIAQLGARVETFEESLGSFRLSSGLFVAVVIVLQVVLVGLTFRGHG